MEITLSDILILLGYGILGATFFLVSGEKLFKYASAASGFVIAAGFAAAGLWEGATSSFITGVRNYLAYRNRDLTWVFIIGGSAFYLVFSEINNLIDTFPFIAYAVMTWAFFKFSVVNIKITAFISSIFWLIYLFYYENEFGFYLQLIIQVVLTVYLIKVLFEKYK